MVSIEFLDEPEIEKHRSENEPHGCIPYTWTFVRDDVVECRAEIAAAVHSTKELSQSVNLSGSALDEDVDERLNPLGGLHLCDHAENLQVLLDPGIHSCHGRLIGFVGVRAVSHNIDHSVHRVADHRWVHHRSVDHM